MCLINCSGCKQTKCYIKYDREILGLVELIENIFEFVLRIYLNLRLKSTINAHVYQEDIYLYLFTNIIYDIILIICY